MSSISRNTTPSSEWGDPILPERKPERFKAIARHEDFTLNGRLTAACDALSSVLTRSGTQTVKTGIAILRQRGDFGPADPALAEKQQRVQDLFKYVV